jgi:hypothetical protein
MMPRNVLLRDEGTEIEALMMTKTTVNSVAVDDR